jgi:hypothetical protein
VRRIVAAQHSSQACGAGGYGEDRRRREVTGDL